MSQIFESPFTKLVLSKFLIFGKHFGTIKFHTCLNISACTFEYTSVIFHKSLMQSEMFKVQNQGGGKTWTFNICM